MMVYTMDDKVTETVVIINEDGSVYPFVSIFDLANEGDDDLRDLIKTYLEKHGRKIGIFYSGI